MTKAASKSYRYAEGTEVSIEKSHSEIRKLLSKYKADGFMVGEHNGIAQLAFQMNDRRILFRMPVPRPTDESVRFYSVNQTRTKAERTEDQAWALCQRESRRKWRALALCIKAKLESVESGIEAFEDAFLAQTVIPTTGQTIGEWVREEWSDAIGGSGLPPLLEGPQK